MGNAIGAKKNKTAKVMKISGETTKLRTPVLAGDVLRDHPGHALLESEAVKHFGVRAKPMEAHQNLEPKRLYFLVELPKNSKERIPRRVRSGITMTAKDRLETLMLERRSVSDLSIVNPTCIGATENTKDGGGGSDQAGGGKRLRMRLPKGEVERLMKESRDEAEVAEKIMNLYIANASKVDGGLGIKPRGVEDGLFDQHGPWKVTSHGRAGGSPKTRVKRVSFQPVDGADKHIAVAS